MTPIRLWPLLAAAVISGALAWLVVRLEYAGFPPLPWTAAAALLLLAVAEVWSGRNIRARISGAPNAKPVVPIAVARMAVLAKASALAAATFGGAFGGFLIYLGSLASKPRPRSDGITAAATVICAAILAGAAVYLERSCRAPEPPADPEMGT
jgi:Protein of unknown function (DUF3180)